MDAARGGQDGALAALATSTPRSPLLPAATVPLCSTSTTTTTSGVRQERVASAASCWFNLTNTIVGSGMLGLPAAFAKLGLGLGSACLVLFALLSAFGLHLLAASAALARNKSTPLEEEEVEEETREEASHPTTYAVVASDDDAEQPRGVPLQQQQHQDYEEPSALNITGGTDDPPCASSGKPATKLFYEASFRNVATAAAPRFATLIDAAVAVKCFGVATSYLIVVGDTVPVVVGPGRGAWSERSTWILGAAMCVTPLCALEKLDGLKFTSALSLLFVLYLTALVVAFRAACDDDDDCDAFGESRGSPFADDGPVVVPDDDDDDPLAALKTATIFVFAYTCHQNIFAVVNEMKRPTPRRLDGVILASIGAAACVYVAVSVSGFLAFGSDVDGDILDNYPNSTPISVARLFVACLVALSYPLNCHPSRACALSLIDQCMYHLRASSSESSLESLPSSSEDDERADDDDDDRLENHHHHHHCRPSSRTLSPRPTTPVPGHMSPPPSSPDAAAAHLPASVALFATNGRASSTRRGRGWGGRRPRRPILAHKPWARILATICFVCGTLAIALSVKSLTVVLSVVGATGSTTVSYILPGGVYARLAPRGWKRSAALGLFWLGVIIMPTALVLIFV